MGVVVGAEKEALLRINGTELWLGEGQDMEDIRVIAIEGDRVVVREKGEEKEYVL